MQLKKLILATALALSSVGAFAGSCMIDITLKSQNVYRISLLSIDYIRISNDGLYIRLTGGFGLDVPTRTRQEAMDMADVIEKERALCF